MLWIAYAYVFSSVVTFVAYGIDKRRAQRRTWRIPESTLQTMALCGGFCGALAGRRVFNHKTGKRYFTIVLYAIITLHLLAWVVWWTRVRD